MLRDLIQEYVPRYIKATTKTEKGHVIIDIVERIRRESPSGVGLVRQNKKNGLWFYIGLEKAKDKIGHALRKASLEKSKSHSRDKRNSRKQQYPSTESLTSLSTSRSPTPVSSGSVPSSPSVQQQMGRYEDGAQAAYHHHYDEAYHRAYHQHYQQHYSAYHQHYAAAPPTSHDPNHENSAIAHRGYDVYYPYPGAHNYPPADYAYSAEAASHHHQYYQPPHQPPQSSPPPSTTHHAQAGGEAHLYSPVSHSPVSHGH
jgi:hypothetical protein